MYVVIPCVIGDMRIGKVMIGLSGSINVIHVSVYKKLNVGPMKHTCVIIQLAHRYN